MANTCCSKSFKFLINIIYFLDIMISAFPKTGFPRLALIHDHPFGWPGGGTSLLHRIFEGYPSDKLIYISSFPNKHNNGNDFPAWLTGQFSISNHANFGKFGMGRLKLYWSCFPWSARTSKIKEIFKNENIECVHAVAHEFLWIPALWAAIDLRIPYVLAIHDHWPSTIRKQIPSKVANFIFGRLIRKVNSIVGAHEGVLDLLKNYFKVSQSCVERDGLSPEEISAMPACTVPSKTPRHVRVGYNGMYITYRSEFTLLRKALYLLRERTGITFKLVLCVEVKLDVIREQGWEIDDLEFHGWKDYQSVQQIMGSCDIFFLPMSFEEDKKELMMWGMSNKTVQYLRAKKPILTFTPSYASISRLAMEYKFGALVTERTPERLLQGLLSLLEEPESNRKCAEEADRCINERFSLRRVKEGIWSLLKKCTENKNHLHKVGKG